jgi:hypothetical protein
MDLYTSWPIAYPHLCPIAETVPKVLMAQKPKTRYRVGKWAKPMVWMRIFLEDRIFDKVVMSQV